MESWEPSQHLLIDTGKPRKTCVEVVGRRTSRILPGLYEGLSKLNGYKTSPPARWTERTQKTVTSRVHHMKPSRNATKAERGNVRSRITVKKRKRKRFWLHQRTQKSAFSPLTKKMNLRKSKQTFLLIRGLRWIYRTNHSVMSTVLNTLIPRLTSDPANEFFG